jgi:hypothetical protein
MTAWCAGDFSACVSRRTSASGASVFRIRADVPARFHAFVQYADNFDQARPNRPIIKNVHRSAYLRLGNIGARVPQMKAADAAQKVGAIPRRRSFRIARDLKHCDVDECGVAMPAVRPPSFGTCRKDVCEIGLGQPRKSKTRHRDQRVPVPGAAVRPSR